MAFDDMKVEKKSFGSYLKKTLKLYFRVMLALALVVGCAVVVVELISRLNANDQTLGTVEEVLEKPHILRIYVDELYAAEDGSIKTRYSEVREGAPIMTGTKMNAYVGSDGKPTGYSNSAYFRAKERYHLEPGGTEHITITAVAESCELEGKNSFPNRQKWEEKGREQLTATYNPRHDITTLDQSDKILRDRILLGQRASVWDGLEYNSQEIQWLRETTTVSTQMYGLFERYVTTSAIKFSAFERSEPHRLMAEAVVEVKCYFRWENDNVINMTDGKTVNEALSELGLVTPENYGYTTVELVEYWQREE